MAKTPASDLWFTHVRFDEKGIHVTDDVSLFSKLKENAQYTLFDYTFIRKDTARVNLPMDSARQLNYVVYTNPSHDNKEYGAFIKDYKYINEGTTEVILSTDYFHTFYSNITLTESFIERSHVRKIDDKPGAFLVPENLAVGDYVSEGNEYPLFSGDTMILVMVNALVKDGIIQPDGSYSQDVLDKIMGSINGNFKAIPGGSIYEGKLNPFKIIMFDPMIQLNQFFDFINAYTELGGADYILSVYLAPKDFIPDSNQKLGGATLFPNTTHLIEVDKEAVYQVSNFEGYYPKNKKLMTYPYTFLRMQNGNGNEKIIKFEDQRLEGNTYGTFKFKSIGTVTNPSPTVNTYVTSNKYFDETDMITTGGYPQLPWNNNTYKAWFANNGGYLLMKLGTTAITIGSAVATGGTSLVATGLATGTAISVLNEVGNFNEAQKDIARTKGSISGASVNSMRNSLNVTVQRKHITKEYAKIIDDYFTMYGYKLNVLEKPNLKSRSHFNYIKTNGFNFYGNIPDAAKSYIKDMFDRGVTLWHNYYTMLDYSLLND